jgi:transposase-like protein
MKCPICDNIEIKNKIRHKEFDSFVYNCSECGHGWTDYDKTFKSNTVFVTQQQRADEYTEKVLKMEINSILEIGSASDFYFLKKIHEKDDTIKLYLNDSYDYSNVVPDYIKFIKNIENIEHIDVVYMCHVLEHISEINEFIKLMKTKSKYLMLEIPCETYPYEKTVYHYQFFNENSFTHFVDKHDMKLLEYEVKFRAKGLHKVIYALIEL